MSKPQSHGKRIVQILDTTAFRRTKEEGSSAPSASSWAPSGVEKADHSEE